MIAGAATRLLLATTRRAGAVAEAERGLQRIRLARTFAGRLGLLTTPLATLALALTALSLRTRTASAGWCSIAQRTATSVGADTLRTTAGTARPLGATGAAIAATSTATLSTLTALTALTAALTAEAALTALTGTTLATTIRTALTAETTTTLAAWRLGEWQRVVVADVGAVEVRFVAVVLVVIIKIGRASCRERV